MIKPVISVDQLIRFAYHEGVNKGLAIHDEVVAVDIHQCGVDLVDTYVDDGVLKFNKLVGETFSIDYQVNHQ